MPIICITLMSTSIIGEGGTAKCLHCQVPNLPFAINKYLG